MSQRAPLEKPGSVLAEEILGHKLDDNTSRDDVKKILEEVITERHDKIAAQKQSAKGETPDLGGGQPAAES